MRGAIQGSAVAAMLLVANVASATEPVCGDVTNDGLVKTADALLVLKRSVSQPVTLSCSAYDDEFSECTTSVTETKAAGQSCLIEFQSLDYANYLCNQDKNGCEADVVDCNSDIASGNAAMEACVDAVPTCDGEVESCNFELALTNLDLEDCEEIPAGKARRTGQTSCFSAAGGLMSCAGSGQDGMFQKGLAPSFFDNGDGTITDNLSGLMWEKLSNNGDIHDVDNSYDYSQSFDRLWELNNSSFAGHTDWRLPNYNELLSLVNLGAATPATFSAFNTACAPGCSVTACSCTNPKNEGYWTNSTAVTYASNVWVVDFYDGQTFHLAKLPPTGAHVRAVRGGY